MAGDNPKVGVDVDLEGAYRQGQQWGENFIRGVNQKVSGGGIAGQVLGSGMPVQAAGSPQNVTSLLSSILQTLHQGFGALVILQGGAGAPPPGGGASVGTTGITTPPPLPPPEEGGDDSKGGRGRGRSSAMAGVYGAGGFPQQAYANMYQSGFYGTQVAQFAAQATSSIPVVGQFLGLVANTMAERDNALRDMMGVYRAGGHRSWSFMHDLMTGSNTGQGAGASMVDRAKMLGVGRSEATQLLALNAAAGDSRQGGFEALLGLQGLYGMGQQGAALTGALQRGGTRDQPATMNLFAGVLANAVTSGLDRGRWGEAFSAMTKAANRIQGGDVSSVGLMQTMNLVGAMGTVSGRYQGDTEASGRAAAMFQGMQEGQGGAFANIAALRAAGLGQAGVSFTDAWMKVQRGGAAGGVGLEAVLRQYMNLPPVRAYLTNPTEKSLNRAVFILSTLLPGYKPADIEAMLRTMAKFDIAGKGLSMLPGGGEGAKRSFVKALTEGRLHTKMQDLAESDPSLNWSGNAIGAREGQIPDMPESTEDLQRQGALRTEPAVERVDAPATGETSSVTSGMRTSSEWMRQHVTAGGRFGAQRKDTGFHGGIDILPTKPGDAVYSPCDGRVVASGIGRAGDKATERNAPGRWVMIKDNDSGKTWGIFHLDPKRSPQLQTGTRVRRGQLLGYTFSTKTFSSGVPTHTHVQVAGAGGDRLNPAEEMNLERILSPEVPGDVPRPGAPQQPVSSTPDSPDMKAAGAPGRGQASTPTHPAAVSGSVDVSIHLSPEARRLLTVQVHRKPATRRGAVG